MLGGPGSITYVRRQLFCYRFTYHCRYADILSLTTHWTGSSASPPDTRYFSGK